MNYIKNGGDINTPFAILDDDETAGVGMEDHFFQTRSRDGLTEELATKIINYLE